MKKLYFLAISVFAFAGCTSIDFDEDAVRHASEQEIKANVESVFGTNFSPNQDWTMSSTGTIKITADANFDDIVKDVEGAVMFNKEHAEKIIRFVKKNKAADTLLVHCYGGESRSRAVCAFVAKMLGTDNSKYFETGHPNQVVYDTLVEVWEES